MHPPIMTRRRRSSPDCASRLEFDGRKRRNTMEPLGCILADTKSSPTNRNGVNTHSPFIPALPEILARCTGAALVIDTENDIVVAHNPRCTDIFHEQDLTGQKFGSLLMLCEELEANCTSEAFSVSQKGQFMKYLVMSSSISHSETLLLVEVCACFRHPRRLRKASTPSAYRCRMRFCMGRGARTGLQCGWNAHVSS